MNPGENLERWTLKNSGRNSLLMLIINLKSCLSGFGFFVHFADCWKIRDGKIPSETCLHNLLGNGFEL